MTTFALKLIASIAMTIDHAYQIIGQWGLMQLGMSQHVSYCVVTIMDIIGRIAFPLYAFLIAEGASRTRSMPKYIGRLLLFAVISEPFFYFALHRVNLTWDGFLDNLSRWNLHNVLFTLALGDVAIFLYQKLERKPAKQRWMWFVPVSLFLIFVAGYVGSDYGMMGVLLIIALYLAKGKEQKAVVILVWSVGLYLLGQGFTGMWGHSLLRWGFAALAAVLVWFYNGKRGKPMKWFFYIYYPAHLLALMLLKQML